MRQPNRTTPVPVAVEDPNRSWTPKDKTNEDGETAVLWAFEEFGRGALLQKDIVEFVEEVLEVPHGTAAAYVSGALLKLKRENKLQPGKMTGNTRAWILL